MGSLMTSCCGNDKPSSVSPGASSGRKRSVLLLVMSVAISFAFQYGLADFVTGLPVTNYVTDAWRSGCDYDIETLNKRCAGNSGVYRSAASAVVFFVLASIAVACKRSANREAWPAKYTLFLFLVIGTCFIPNDPIFLKIFLNIARVGAVLFILAQQIVLIDLAHNWNDSWVEKADAAEAEEIGSGKKWLGAILASSAILFLVAIIGIGLLFYFFSGCSVNTAFITVTLILSIAITAAQLSGEEGSLLASGVVSAYATSLCYSAGVCNFCFLLMGVCKVWHHSWFNI